MNDVALPSTSRVGQATAIEQSRAIAEVYASAELARRFPRDVQAALIAVEDSCKQLSLAERAHFRFPRAGSTISGPSVYLARELARCWGNVSHGVAELRRDDEHGQSEMLAFAWDIQTNTRSSTIFIVPHKRDKKDGPVALVDMRDIYENNANAGARRVRECIFSVLPPWLVSKAEELCRETVKSGGGKPLAERVSEALKRFRALNVTEDDIVRKLGRPTDKWSPDDLADLTTIYGSIKRGETKRDDEFPPPAVTAAEIQGNGSRPAAGPRAEGDGKPADYDEAAWAAEVGS